jgi:hypothetical protein
MGKLHCGGEILRTESKPDVSMAKKAHSSEDVAGLELR